VKVTFAKIKEWTQIKAIRVILGKMNYPKIMKKYKTENRKLEELHASEWISLWIKCRILCKRMSINRENMMKMIKIF